MGRFKCACCGQWWSAGASGSKTVTTATLATVQAVLEDAYGELALPVGAKVCTAHCFTAERLEAHEQLIEVAKLVGADYGDYDDATGELNLGTVLHIVRKPTARLAARLEVEIGRSGARVARKRVLDQPEIERGVRLGAAIMQQRNAAAAAAAAATTSRLAKRCTALRTKLVLLALGVMHPWVRSCCLRMGATAHGPILLCAQMMLLWHVHVCCVCVSCPGLIRVAHSVVKFGR
jgi:hypothetical protein